MCVHGVDGFHYDNETATNIRQLKHPFQYVAYIDSLGY